MADLEATVTLRGDSSELVEAADDAQSAIEASTAALNKMVDEAEATPTAMRTATSSMGSLTTQAKSMQSVMVSSETAFAGLGRAVSAVSPEAGAALSSLSSLSGGMKALTASLGPVGIALAAVSSAIAIGTKLYKDHKEAVETLRAEQAAHEAFLKKYTARVADVSPATQDAVNVERQYLATLAGSREAMAENERARLQQAAAIAAERREQDLLTISQRMAANAMAAMELERTGRRGEAAQIREIIASQEKQRDKLLAINIEMRELNAAAENAATSVAGIEEGVTRTHAATTEAAVSMRELAEAAALVAFTDLDTLPISDMLQSGGDAAVELARTLRGANDELLAHIGLTGDQIMQIRDLDEANFTLSERIAHGNAIIAEQASMAAEAAQIATDLAQAGADAAARAAQDGADAAAAALQEIEDKAEQLRQSLKDGLESAIAGGVTSAVQGLSTAFFEAAQSGEDMAGALGKAALQAIGNIAVQFGTLMTTTAIGMAFMPGFHGNAVGLGIGGAALIAFGAGLGVAANAMGADTPSVPDVQDNSANQARSSGFGDSSMTAIVGERGITTIDPARDARRAGDEERNASRYGIDRRRAYA